jgi:adenine-specific DNA methylase
LLAHPRNDQELQKALLKFIGDFADWDNANDQQYLRVGRELVKAAHPEETPLVVDPFAGGGSIPLEALRLGCDAFASDLNPVACLILKVMLENIPRHGPKLAEELRKAGAEVKAEAEKELAEFYPPDPDGARPIAYLWSRTVRCEAPDCGAEIPLMRSFWLAKKANRKLALRLVGVEKIEAMKDPLHCVWGETTKARRFEIFAPRREDEVADGTVSLAKATCPCCGRSLPPPRVRAQLTAKKGGADVEFDKNKNRIGGARLLAVVTLNDGVTGRQYRLPVEADYGPVLRAQNVLEKLMKQKLPNGLGMVPNEPLPTPLRTPYKNGDPYFNFLPVLNYGMTDYGRLFTSRQKISLSILARSNQNIESNSELEKAVKEAMGIVISRCADYNSSFCRWATTGEFVGNTFGRQALPPVWDFCETFIFSEESGGYPGALAWVARVVEKQGNARWHPGQSSLEDASKSPLPDDSADVWFTDPPYYDAVPYSDLSEYFFVWLKRALVGHPLLKDPYDPNNSGTPKSREIIDTLELLRGVPKLEAKKLGIPIKDRGDFEQGMSRALAEGQRITKNDGIASVVFAHKTTEGWEALLTGMIHGGWVITASWPIATERPGRLRSQESAALATSVHLICRPRNKNAPIGEWAEVLRELPKRVGDWMERLHNEGVRGADMVFACIGPALEIYSRYTKVETAEGRAVELPEYLSKIWEIVGRKALENVLGTAEAKARNGAVGALEEDARLTALFLWTLQSTASNGVESAGEADDEAGDEDEGNGGKQKGGYSVVFDVARRFSQPLGINLPKWEGRIIKIEKGVVRLLPVHERATQLFGEEGAQAIADRIEDRQRGPVQMKLFPDEGAKPPEIKGRARGRKAKSDVSDEALKARHEATTLDKIHAAMLLQDSGRTNALRALIEAEQQRGPEFMRLANALSALYPPKSEEKRLLDAMILSAPR